MSEENNNNDPLSADVGDKELTKMPLIPANKIVRLEIKKPTVGPPKSNPGRLMLTLPCCLTEDTKTVDGSTARKGFPIYHRIGVTITDERSAQQIASDVAKICQAVGVKGVKVSDIIADPMTHLDGKVFDAKTRVTPEKDGYPESNAITPIALA